MSTKYILILTISELPDIEQKLFNILFWPTPITINHQPKEHVMRIGPRTLWQVLPHSSSITCEWSRRPCPRRSRPEPCGADGVFLAQPFAARPDGHWPQRRVTTAEALTVNQRMGVEVKAVNKVAPGVYSLAGWGIGISYAIDAPSGWIIIDTGDTTTAAAEMRQCWKRHGPPRQGRGDPADALALCQWHRRLARPRNRALGP